MIIEPTTHLPFILLAEDTEDDVFSMRYAFQQNGLMKRHFVVENGEEAIQYLAGRAPYANPKLYPRPALLILDLKMPTMDGFDVLTWVRGRPEFATLPIVMLSSVCTNVDLKRARLLGADYRAKPSKLPEFITLVLELCQRWSTGKLLVGTTTGKEIASRRVGEMA